MCVESKGCGCSGGGTKLVFACSGAADVGAIADQAARALTRQGAGKMYCMAGLGGDVGPIVETTKKACAILAIDGCNVDCVKSTLERLGFGGYAHLRVTDLGMQKGSSPANDGHIAKVVSRGVEMLA